MTKPQRLPYAGQPSLFALDALKQPAADNLMFEYLTPNRCIEPSTRHSQDEYRCTTCGVIWALDEYRPPCQDH